MKQLYAYDFDKTLIPYDSFRRYLWHLMRYRPFNVSYLLLLRKLRIISNVKLKEYVTKLVSSSPTLQQDAKLFAESIKQDIYWHNKHNEGTILIISASPMVYMKYVVDDIPCELLCSDYIDDQYVEMYGKTKAIYLHHYFPISKYNYIYAMSDSESDLCWMKEFNKYEIIKDL